MVVLSMGIKTLRSTALPTLQKRRSTLVLAVNPWVMLGASIVPAGAIGGAYLKGRGDGKAVIIASQAKDDQIRLETLQLAQLAAAEEIAKITVVNRTIYAKATHEIVEKPAYRDCRHGPDTLGLLNNALTNTESEPAGDSSVSGANAARW